MPRFADEVQKRVDAKHANISAALEETQALFGVLPAARLAMPIKVSQGIFFYKKSRFLTTTQCKNFSSIDYRFKFQKLHSKIEKYFSFKPEIWEPLQKSYFNNYDNDRVRCFNSSHNHIPRGWDWKKDRQLSAIIWLEESTHYVLEFPYLKNTPDSESPKIKPKAGQLWLFPSHPLYAFKILENQSPVPFLHSHATREDIQKPTSR